MSRRYSKPASKLGPYERLLRETAIAENITVKSTREVIEAFIARLPEAVWATGKLAVPGIGLFRVRSRKPRRISNPQTGELMMLPRARVVVARVAASWRRR